MRRIAEVNGRGNYYTDLVAEDIVYIDNSKAILYIIPSEIRYGIVITVYRKSNEMNFNKVELVNSGDNLIIVKYLEPYADLKGKINLRYNSVIMDTVDFRRKIEVFDNVDGCTVVIENSRSVITRIGDTYDRIMIYATIYFI